MSVAESAGPHRIVAPEVPASDQAAARSVTEQFAGTWQLVSWKVEQANGQLMDPSLGPDPRGWIMYHRGGHMSVVIMRSERPNFAS
jgi:hypothetical protein